MFLKTAKIRADALHKSVYLLPFPMLCLIKTGNTLTGSGPYLHIKCLVWVLFLLRHY